MAQAHMDAPRSPGLNFSQNVSFLCPTLAAPRHGSRGRQGAGTALAAPGGQIRLQFPVHSFKNIGILYDGGLVRINRLLFLPSLARLAGRVRQSMSRSDWH